MTALQCCVSFKAKLQMAPPDVCLRAQVFLHSNIPPCLCVLGAQLGWALCDPMDYSPPGSSVHGLHARILEWVAISSSRPPS